MSQELLVTNLGPATTPLELTRLFGHYGSVRWADVRPPFAGGAGPSGLVEMSTAAEGDAAIAALDGHTFDGRALSVRPATERERTRPARSPTFGSMNMPDPADVPTGATRLDFGDPHKTDRHRGLPHADEAPPPALAGAAQRSDRGPAHAPAPDGAAGEFRGVQRTYDGIFGRPVSRGLRWPEVHAMLGTLAAVTVGEDGATTVTRNGRVLRLPRPPKNVASVRDLMAIRRFIEQSENQELR